MSDTPQAQDKSRASLISEKIASRWAAIKPSEDVFSELSVKDAMDAHIATVASFPEIADLSSEEKREVLIGTWRNTWNTQLRQEHKAQYAADYDVTLTNGLARHESGLLQAAQGSELHHDVFEGGRCPRTRITPTARDERELDGSRFDLDPTPRRRLHPGLSVHLNCRDHGWISNRIDRARFSH